MADQGYDEAYDANEEGYENYEQPANIAGHPFVALYDYTANNTGELTFKVGDVLTVISEVKEGWYSASLNGQTGYAPSNYLQFQENSVDQQAAKRARKEKKMAQRKELREKVEEKRKLRKQLEEDVKLLEEANRERKGLIKKLANPTSNPNYTLNDLITLTIQLQLADKQQSRYAELSSSLMMGLSSLQSQLDADVKAGRCPVEEAKNKFDSLAEQTIKTFTNSREKLVAVVRSQKEFSPLLWDLRSTVTAGLQ